MRSVLEKAQTTASSSVTAEGNECHLIEDFYLVCVCPAALMYLLE